MARHLAAGYYAFLVAHFVAVNPKSINSLPPATALGRNPTGEIKRKDGTFHTFDLRHYLDLLREDQSIQERFLRTWAAGALLMLGDKLSKHSYFDHAPILEMVYHLRNGIAHGNQFNIDDRGRRRLRKHAAHNRDTIWRRGCKPKPSKFLILNEFKWLISAPRQRGVPQGRLAVGCRGTGSARGNGRAAKPRAISFAAV